VGEVLTMPQEGMPKSWLLTGKVEKRKTKTVMALDPGLGRGRQEPQFRVISA